MPKFVTPKRSLDVFTCPYCDVTATQKWYGNERAVEAHRVFDDEANEESVQFFGSVLHEETISEWLFSRCESCKQIAVWHNDEMIHPFSCPVDEPNADMPESIKNRYIEASKVVALSPVSAAALLRLALQLLLKEVLQNESSESIYADIQKLKTRPIDSNLVRAFDIIRISGNESVHPGTLDLNENKDDAYYLFDLLNMICDQFFTQPRKMQEMYEKMPESKRIISDQCDS